MIKVHLEKTFPETVANEKSISKITAIYFVILYLVGMTPHFPEFSKVIYSIALRVGSGQYKLNKLNFCY